MSAKNANEFLSRGLGTEKSPDGMGGKVKEFG